MGRTEWLRFTGPILGAAWMAIVQLGCGGEAETAQPVIRPVRYQEVVSSGGRRERSFSGTAQAGVESQLSFRVAGSVQSVSAVVGDSVQRGREIARLDATDYRLQLQEAEASLAQAIALGTQGRRRLRTHQRPVRKSERREERPRRHSSAGGIEQGAGGGGRTTSRTGPPAS